MTSFRPLQQQEPPQQSETSSSAWDRDLQAFGQLALIELKSDHVVVASGYPDALDEASTLQPGRSLRDHFGLSLQEMIVTTGERLCPSPLFLGNYKPRTGNDVALLAQAPTPEDLIILELVPPPRSEDAAGTLATLRRIHQRLASAPDSQTLLDLAVRELKYLSRFDRVAVHRLLPDGRELVLAEARNSHLPSMLERPNPLGGASPEVAGRFNIGRCHFIPDVNYRPKKLLGRPLALEKIPDLNRCLLRGTAPHYLEFLRNNGIEASLSWPLVVEGKVWGFITCHNATRVAPDYALLEKCHRLLTSLTEQLEQQEKQAAQALLHHVELGTSRLLKRLAQEDLSEESLLTAEGELLSIFPADGITVICGAKMVTKGMTPPRAELRRLGHCLGQMLSQREGVFFSDCLASIFPRAGDYAEVASGALAIRLSLDPQTIVIWFRREEIQSGDSQALGQGACFLAGPEDALPACGERSHIPVRRKSPPWSELIIRQARLLQERASFYFQQRQIEALNRQLRAANRQLAELAERDPLTGLANRRIFEERLALEWKRAQRDCRSLSLILVDVDFFKRYNDRYGHPAGDRCLIQIAELLEAAGRRAGDLAVRYGGEEFALLLPGTDRPGAERIAEKLRQDVLALGIEHADNPVGLVSISLGVASTRPHCSTAETRSHLVKTADVALYEAKAGGRNRVCVREM